MRQNRPVKSWQFDLLPSWPGEWQQAVPCKAILRRELGMMDGDLNVLADICLELQRAANGGRLGHDSRCHSEQKTWRPVGHLSKTVRLDTTYHRPLVLPTTAALQWTHQANTTVLTFRNPASYIQDGHTATLNKPHFLNIFSTNTSTELFKRAAHSPFLSLQSAVYFTMLPFWFPYYSHFIYRMC
jgi:hypothetical protein